MLNFIRSKGISADLAILERRLNLLADSFNVFNPSLNTSMAELLDFYAILAGEVYASFQHQIAERFHPNWQERTPGLGA